jgi:uroporphyrinogen III methyltransferase/synthase
VGEVVRLRERLSWYERLPLFGQRIVVTRASGQAGALRARLEALGAGVIEMPTIEIQPTADYGPLDRAIAQLASYDWLIFTSANGVRAFVERMDRSAADFRALHACICAIGPATRAAVEALHLKVDLMGTEYVAESLLKAFEGHPLEGTRILLPRAAVARDLIPAELARRGAQVDVVEAYRTVVPQDAAARARKIFGGSRKPDWIAFTSSSTVRNFASVVAPDALAGVRVASIGPVTTRTARELGIEVAVEAREFTVDGLVEALHLAQNRDGR